MMRTALSEEKVQSDAEPRVTSMAVTPLVQEAQMSNPSPGGSGGVSASSEEVWFRWEPPLPEVSVAVVPGADGRTREAGSEAKCRWRTEEAE